MVCVYKFKRWYCVCSRSIRTTIETFILNL
uniref:Uncharacterized protein n=1 Tax=Anguilla anguilla TaxID=7936 RepID=A0A0E9RWZ7_ANGAN